MACYLFYAARSRTLLVQTKGDRRVNYTERVGSCLCARLRVVVRSENQEIDAVFRAGSVETQKCWGRVVPTPRKKKNHAGEASMPFVATRISHISFSGTQFAVRRLPFAPL